MYTVLFADDSANTRELFCCVLRSAGYSVLEAQNAAEVLSLARAHTSTIDSLRRPLAGCHPETPVLFISGNPGRLVLQDPLLRKPFTPVELISKVTALLNNRHLAAAPVSAIPSDHKHT